LKLEELEDVIVRKYLKFFHSDFYLENTSKVAYPKQLKEYKVIKKLYSKNASESIFKIMYKEETLILKYIELLDDIERPQFEKEV
jgi:hypothetical protein